MDINLTDISPEEQVNLPIPLRSSSLRQNLVYYLQTCLPSAFTGTVFRHRHEAQIIYRCRLMPRRNLSLTLTTHPTPPVLYFTAHRNSSHWLELSLQNDQLSPWLDFVWFNPLTYTPLSVSAYDDFPLQYAHARCCSALRFGGNFTVNKINIEKLPIWSALQLDSKTRSLIHALVESSDHCQNPSLSTQILIARQLGYAVLDFLSEGTLHPSNIVTDSGQSARGLVILTQKILRSLLEQGCGGVALEYL